MLDVWTSINGDDDNDQLFGSNDHGNDGGDDDGEVYWMISSELCELLLCPGH